ncbi:MULTISPECIES: hypothetical protein [Pseudomonas]|uniref:Uncharacterized protein n=1 Tax=Pseudomonas fluorescens TaxID=294 RepID=A0A166QN42_PSEFL|nr:MULTISPECIES: hypothetical protein [Pseudomonas]KZN20565.1 hypothetical protein A1D17_03220 [Pseudomonas fluorescens]
MSQPTATPKIYKAGYGLLALIGLGFVLYLPTVIDDVKTYRAVASDQHGCCGFVSESPFERPVTYLMVDAWTTPSWSENAAKTERWLTSDGKVGGETKFWRLLQREPITNVQP